MKLATVFVSVIAAIIASYLTVTIMQPASVSPKIEKQESAYERVLRTGKIRCAYGLWEPGVILDPNTGELSGIAVDIMHEIGKALNLEIEYTSEIPWDSIGTSLKAGKVDAHCAGVFATPSRARSMAFSTPLFFSPTVAFSRVGDNRFDFNLQNINNPNVIVAVSDDSITTEIYEHDFPQAKTYELPQLVPPEELFIAIQTKKADVAFNSPARLESFAKHNPDVVKVIPTEKPLRIFGNTVSVSAQEQELVRMLNTTIEQLIDGGTVDKIINKYKQDYSVDFIVPVERPYKWDIKTND